MNRSESGFALVEAVVALGIVAAIFGATFQTIAMARGAIAAAEERRAAMLEAQSLTAELGATIPLLPGTSSGQSDSFHWRVEIDPTASREIGVPLMHSTVTVADQHDRQLARLETLRLGR